MAVFRDTELSGFPALLKVSLLLDIRSEGMSRHQKEKLMIEMGMETEATLANRGIVDDRRSGSGIN